MFDSQSQKRFGFVKDVVDVFLLIKLCILHT